jgi:UDP-glucose 4-epimerase
LAQCSDRPAAIYVPLDTIRDYLYADDCAGLILDAIDRAHAEARSGPISVTKILASGDGVTVGNLLGVLKVITKRRPNVTLMSSPIAALQASDLRFRSVVWPELDARELTPLAAGIRATVDSVRARLLEHGWPVETSVASH